MILLRNIKEKIKWKWNNKIKYKPNSKKKKLKKYHNKKCQLKEVKKSNKKLKLKKQKLLMRHLPKILHLRARRKRKKMANEIIFNDKTSILKMNYIK